MADFRPDRWLANQWDNNIATCCAASRKSRYNHYTGTDIRCALTRGVALYSHANRPMAFGV
jgi:hypothetical protein